MKRIASAMLWLFVVFSVASLAYGQASVPNLINFQGLLTDTAGAPVSDGSHAVDFRIYSAVSGGTLLWTELTTQTTSNGVFTHQLGSITTLSQTLFQSYDSLFLEITAEGEIITPRTQLISTPYTRLANHLESRDASNDTVTIKTFDNQISTYGFDGQEQIRLWGESYGEIFLYDFDATNDLTVRLTANASSGGELELRDDNGVNTIDLHGGLTGDGSVIVPGSAINALEMLDEPGVASDTAYDGGTTLTGAVQTIASRSINPPGTDSGYVLAIGTAQVDLTHTNGVSSWAIFGVSSTAGVFPAGQDVVLFLPSTAPTGQYRFPVTVHGLFKTGTLSDAFYFLAEENSGDLTVADVSLTLVFIPTAYGIVTPPLLAGQSENSEQNAPKVTARNFPDETTQIAEAEVFESERLARENEILKARMTEIEARLQKLETQENQQAGIE